MAELRMRIPTTAERICCALMLPQYARWLMARLDENKASLPKWANGCKTAEEYLMTHPDALGEHLPKFQNEAWCKLMECLCDYLLEQTLRYFRVKIERSMKSVGCEVQSIQRMINDGIFDKLPDEFSDSDLLSLKDGQCEAARSLRRRWLKAGLIRMSDKSGWYVKVG